MQDKKRVLVVEDRTDVQDTIRKNVERAGYDVDTASTLQEALERIRRRTYHIALLDVNLSDSRDGEDRAGIEIAAKIRDLGEGTRCIVISGESSEEVPVDAIEAGVSKYIIKKRIRTSADYIDPLNKLMSSTEIRHFGNYSHLHAYLARPRGRDDWENQGIFFLGGGADFFGRVLKDAFASILPVLRQKEATYSLTINNETGAMEGLFWSKAHGCAVWMTIGRKGAALNAPTNLGLAKQLRRHEKGPENFGLWLLPEVPRDKFLYDTYALE